MGQYNFIREGNIKFSKEVVDNLAAHGFVVGDVAQDSVNSVTRGDVEKNKEMVNLIFQN